MGIKPKYTMPIIQCIGCIVLISLAASSLHAKSHPHSFSEPKTNWYFSLGPQIALSGAKAKFENLGTIPQMRAPSLQSGVHRLYDDGFVNADSERAAESDATTTIVGDRYHTFMEDENGDLIQTGDYLSYNANQTRSWGYTNAAQVNGEEIYMNSYSSTSEGASMEEEEGMKAGFEMQFSKVLFKLKPGVHVSLMGAFGLSHISVESSGRVMGTLNIRTDTYNLNAGATAPDAAYSGPSFDVFDDGAGNTYPSALETTTPLSQMHSNSVNSSTAGAAEIDGTWEINGAHTTLRLGPALHARLSEMLQLTVSTGISGHFAGTEFKYTEKLVNLPTTNNTISHSNKSSASEFILGYYVSARLESWLNDRAGIYLGVYHQAIGDYEQKLDDRLAKIDLGSSTGIECGLLFRF